MNGAPQALAGLFAGGMPKLKSAGQGLYIYHIQTMLSVYRHIVKHNFFMLYTVVFSTM